jgi:uncharacterized membrane protein
MSLVIFALNHADGFAFAMMGLAAFFAGSLVLRTGREPIQGTNPAIRRKQRAERKNLFSHAASISVCLIVFALTITEIRAYAGAETELSPALEIAGTDGEILIPVETINDGNLHRFQYRTVSGTAVRFIVIRKSESAYGVGLDACDICGPTGYYQRGNQIVCKLCDVVMNIATIGFPGGCNPVPLRFSIAQSSMIILTKDLDAEAPRFQGQSHHAAQSLPPHTPMPLALPGSGDTKLSLLIKGESGEVAGHCSTSAGQGAMESGGFH